ncbi:hypothetical protein ON010_g10358 [Phytophthora cinnamomi]|nr:hypothetical protein ON010_g10358 [Phytophthora cinnamomi]
MATLTLSRGSFLLVFPEDLNVSISSPTYAKVSNARGAKVTVRLETTDDDTGSIVRLSRATALTRKVDSRDAKGEQLGTWVRQAVCAKVDGYFRYGQVAGCSDSNLVINTKSGPVEATSGDICDSVYPVVAMIMGCHEFPLRSWSYSQRDKIHNTIMERLLNPTSSALTISVAQLLHELLPDVSPAYDCMYSWIGLSTGRRSRVSLQRVINYVYYIDGGKRVPANMQTSFGTSFCEMNPCQPAATDAGTSTASQIDDRPTTAAPNTSSFFDMTAVDDVENAADEAVLAQALLSNGSNCPVNAERTVPVNRSQQPQLGHVGLALGQPRQIDPIANPAQPTVPSRMKTETSAAVEIRDLVRMHKPHLLLYLLESR